MTTNSPRRRHADQAFSAGKARSARRRLGHISVDSSPMRELIDVAMVGLMGGGPRLAIRAARVLLEDSYASRASAHQVQAHKGTSSRGE
jgi:hypothetical protein